MRRAARPGLCRTQGASIGLYMAPPAGSVVSCLDAMGPQGAKSFPGPRLVRPSPTGGRRRRVPQDVDSGRRGSGDGCGAFVPATGPAFTVPYPSRTSANWGDFRGRVDAWAGVAAARV